MTRNLTECTQANPEAQDMAAYCTGVIVASGTARRMNGIDKIMVNLAGRPVLLWTLQAFEANTSIQEIVVVTRQDLIESVKMLCRENNLYKVKKIVPGGNTRTDSVLEGLRSVSQDTKFVAIQDGARPLVTDDIITTTIQKAIKTGAAAPAIAVKDTIKVARNQVIVQTPDRQQLFAVQTPQVFELSLIREALREALQRKIPLTDDCSAVEALGKEVYLVTGSERNMKITTPMDLILAERLLEGDAIT